MQCVALNTSTATIGPTTALHLECDGAEEESSGSFGLLGNHGGLLEDDGKGGDIGRDGDLMAHDCT